MRHNHDNYVSVLNDKDYLKPKELAVHRVRKQYSEPAR